MKEGSIVQVDTPQQLILHPKTQFVKDFIGEKKSPWQTAIDVIADQSEVHVISKKEFENNKYPKMDMFIIKDEINMYEGEIDNGVEIEIKTLDNDNPLHEATEIIQNKDQ